MTGPFRIGVFVILLAAVAAGATAIGSAVGPLDRGQQTPDAAAEHNEAAMAPGTPAADGLAVATDGLRLSVRQTTLVSGRAQPFAFDIIEPDGRRLRAYDLEHEREMHLVVVARDLSAFHHLHPTIDAAGVWRTDLRLADPGPYRAFADFSTAGRRSVLGADLFVPGSAAAEPLPAPTATVGAGPFAVSLAPVAIHADAETELRFDVTESGRPVTVEPYLGARGHLVILREGDLGYLHTHADENRLTFTTAFPSAGRYRAFLQFSHAGRVFTAAFTLEAAQ